MAHDADAKDAYADQLRDLQIALIDAQIATIEAGRKVCILFEGRDGAGKDGAIKRIIEPLSVRATRIVALPKPSDRETDQWWFQRYVAHLPARSEWALYNRSWYNRAGVERVMGFSTLADCETFLRDAPAFERMLTESGMVLIKFWLDISKSEQKHRLKARKDDPLKRMKLSSIDDEALARFDAYSDARDEMLRRTHTPEAPWTCVIANDKKTTRINIIRHILHVLDPKSAVSKPDADQLFAFDPAALSDGRLAR